MNFKATSPMMRFLHWALVSLLCLHCIDAAAQVTNFNVYTPDIEKYPTVRAYYGATRNGNPVALQASDFIVKENGVAVPAAAISQKCSTIKDGPAIRVVLVIDQSNSMTNVVLREGGKDITRFDIVKAAAKTFIDQVDYIPPTAIAIVSFDGESYLRSPFNNNQTELKQAVDDIPPGSATRYNDPMLHEQWGAIKLLKDGPGPPDVKRVVIFLTDGDPNASPVTKTQEISDGLAQNGIIFYGITVFNGMNENLTTWARRTGGRTFEVNSSSARSQLSQIYKEIAEELQAKEVCWIEWPSAMGCTEASRLRKCDITCTNATPPITSNIEYVAPLSSVFQVTMSATGLSFGNPLPNQTVVKKLTVKAENAPLLITGASIGATSCGTATFKFVNNTGTLPITIPKGGSYTFDVEFKQGAQQVLCQTSLTLTGDPCNPTVVTLIGGINQVTLVQPNRAQSFSGCEDVDIEWDGVPASKEVTLQYSSDNGATWNLLAANVKGLKYTWPTSVVQNLSKDGQYLIKVIDPASPAFMWAKSGGGTLKDSAFSVAVSTDALSVAVGGNRDGNMDFGNGVTLGGTNAQTAGWVAKYTALGGTPIWALSIEGTSGAHVSGVTFGPQTGTNERVYATGYFVGDGTFGAVKKNQSSDKFVRNFFMTTISNTGTPISVHDLGPRTNTAGEAYGTEIAFDQATGKVYAKGKGKGRIAYLLYSGQSGTLILSPTQFEDFVCTYDLDGNLVDIRRGTNSSVKTYTGKTATDKDGNLYEVGSFTGSKIVAAQPNLVSKGQSDFFMTKFGSTPGSTSQSSEPFQIAVAVMVLVDSNKIFQFGDVPILTTAYKGVNQGLCNYGNLSTTIVNYQLSNPTEFTLVTAVVGRQFPSINCETVALEFEVNLKKVGQSCTDVTFFAECSDPVSLTVCAVGLPPCSNKTQTDTSFAVKTVIQQKNTMLIKNAYCNETDQVRTMDITLGGANSGDFRITKVGTATFPPFTGIQFMPNECKDIEIEFFPQTTTGLRIADLTFTTTNFTCPPTRFVVTGEAIAPLAASVDPPGQTWGCVDVGKRESKTVSIKNDGQLVVRVTSLDIANTTNFSLVSPPAVPFDIPIGGSQALTVEFAPTAAGTVTTQIRAVCADANNIAAPINIEGNLTGKGCVPAIAVSKNCFPLTIVGQSLQMNDVITIVNSGEADLVVNDIRTLPASTEFTAFTPQTTPPTFPFTVPANGGSVSVSATFSPAGIGQRTATAEIISNDPGGIATIELCGEGGLSDGVQDFGEVYLCDSKTLEYTLPTNTGSTSVSYSAQISGADQASFSISPLSLTISPGQSGKFFITYTPGKFGDESAVITVGSAQVSVLGKGVTTKARVYANPKEFPNAEPGETYKVVLSASLDRPVGTLAINEISFVMQYNSTVMDLTKNVAVKTLIPDWNWVTSETVLPSMWKTLYITGTGSTGIGYPGKIDMAEVTFSSYLGDSLESKIYVDGEPGTNFLSCVTPVEGESGSIKYTEICFASGRQVNVGKVAYSLSINPSPVQNIAHIEYGLGFDATATVQLRNSLGEVVTTLVSGKHSGGLYELDVNLSELPSGLYYCTIQSGVYSHTERLIITK